MLKIWGRSSSINVQKVMWAVAALGIKHERIDLGGKFGGLDAPEQLARNPHGLIPVIDDGETTYFWLSSPRNVAKISNHLTGCSATRPLLQERH